MLKHINITTKIVLGNLIDKINFGGDIFFMTRLN